MIVSTRDFGAVANAAARRVMEGAPHTRLIGDGATRFARDQGFAQQLLTPEAGKACAVTDARGQAVVRSAPSLFRA